MDWRSRGQGLLLSVALLVQCVVSQGADAASLEEASAALERGDGVAAAASYEALIAEHGPSADLYFNQGVAWARAERLGDAVLAFERSLSLEPDAEDAERALTVTRRALREKLLSESVDRELTQGESEEIGRWRFFHAWDPGVVSWVLLIAWMLGFAALFGRRRAEHPAVRDGLAVFAVIAVLTAMAMGGYAVGQWWTRDVRPAIVMEDRVSLYENPTKMSRSDVPDTLYHGALVEIVGSHEGWQEVVLMDGRRGWLQADAVADVRVDRWPARAAEAR